MALLFPGLTSLLRLASQIAGSEPATLFRGRTRRWTEILERVARLAQALQDLGLNKGDRVALLALNSDRYLETYFAVWWAGGVIVPLNTRWSAAECGYAIDEARPRILMLNDHFLPHLASLGLTADCEIVFMGDGEAPEGIAHYEALIAAAAPAPEPKSDGGDLAALFYTGGTTGHPRGVMLSHGAMMANTIGVGAVIPRIRGDVRLHVAPMFHIGDAGAIFLGTLHPSLHVMLDRFVPEDVLETIARDRVTTMFLVPTMMNLLLQQAGAAGADLSSVRRVLYGASPMPESVLRTAMRAMPQAEFYQLYGQTELAPVATILEPVDHILEGPAAKRLASAGRAAPHVEIRIRSPEGTGLPPGSVGEIHVRGPNTMLGYWQKPEATAKAKVDGWVATGDGGYIDEDGFVYVVDRLKDMIISGGENIYSTEVEDALMKHEDIAECAVIGIPSEEWGEAVHAIILPKPGAEIAEADIIRHCKTLISSYKCPRSIEIATGLLPRTGAQKILKRDLRKPYWEGRGRGVN